MIRPGLACGMVMTVFESLSVYEKGVAAQFLLEDLIKQGRFGDAGGEGPEIIIPIKKWQLELLACFCKEMIGRGVLPYKREREASTQLPS